MQKSAYTVQASAIKCVDCRGKRIDLITPERFHFVANFTTKWLPITGIGTGMPVETDRVVVECIYGQQTYEIDVYMHVWIAIPMILKHWGFMEF